jgi:hypothetical protein
MPVTVTAYYGAWAQIDLRRHIPQSVSIALVLVARLWITVSIGLIVYYILWKYYIWED